MTEDVLELMQQQNRELRLELDRRRLRCMELEDKCTELRGTISELLEQNKKLRESIGEDIELFYDKARRVIENQFGLGLKMRPLDLIKLWFHFVRASKAFMGSHIDQALVYRLEQTATQLAYMMVERGEIMLERDQVGDMLERIIYPFITIDIGGEQITWQDLRDKFKYTGRTIWPGGTNDP